MFSLGALENMKRRWRSLAALVVAVGAFGALSPAAIADSSAAMRAVQGHWLVAGKNGIFYLGPCDRGNTRLCGWITGLDYQGPTPPKDHWGRSECGLALLLRLQEQNDGSWSGNILDPRSGRVYDANVRVMPDGKLKLRGYLGLPIFGQTEIWTRYHGPAPGPQCRMQSSASKR